MSSGTPATGHGGVLDTLKTLGRIALEILHARLDLLTTELAEEQGRITELLLIGAVALLCFFLAVVFAAFFVVILFWDTSYRLVAPGVIAGALATAAVGLWLEFRKRIQVRPKLFSATLEEIGADVQRLR